jgi:UDP-galactopyranose mutase
LSGDLDCDLLVVGAGPSGCVVAERAASVLGLRVLVVERRPYVAGACHDRVHESGVLIHEHGPHYFRSDDRGLVAYLSRFTKWIPARYEVRSSVDGRLLPFPINLTTLEEFFGVALDAESGRALLAAKALPIGTPRNSEELVLSRVGRELYEAFYLGYTRKQWGRHPRALDAAVCGRIPVRFDRNASYVDAPFQRMPARGYTALFRRMLDHPAIRVRLGVDFRALRDATSPRAVVYTGPLDEYFDCRLGRLPWRSLRFEHRLHEREWVQPCVQINYPGEEPHTRTFEIKHVTGERHPRTVVTTEYPAADGEPYYPVPGPESAATQRAYRALADAEERAGRVFFTGRLATYAYLNSDQAMLAALATFERLKAALAAA